jgi:hypothetical protein
VVSEQVRLEIEAYSQRMLTGTPLLARARQGRITPIVVHAYLRSAHYLISHTVPHLRAARDVALAEGAVELAAFFADKEREEAGHETWAESDMRRLAECFGELGAVAPVPAIVNLTRLNERLIRDDPRLYIVYMVCAEYFTVLLGPAWIEALTRGCGVPATALTVVSKHVEADTVHAREGFDAIDRFVAVTLTWPRVREAVRAIFENLEQFPEDLLRLCQAGSAAPEAALTEPL